jgi:hypothetical protein
VTATTEVPPDRVDDDHHDGDLQVTDTAGDPPRADAGKRRGLLVALVVVLLTAALGGAIALVVANDDGGTPDPLTITAAPGTGEEVAGSEDFGVVGSIVRLEPGQEIVLVNNDEKLHSLGPLSAAPGETVRQTFATEGRYITYTSLRSDGRFTILVENTN